MLQESGAILTALHGPGLLMGRSCVSLKAIEYYQITITETFRSFSKEVQLLNNAHYFVLKGELDSDKEWDSDKECLSRILIFYISVT